MFVRNINLTNAKDRDAVVSYVNFPPKARGQSRTKDGGIVRSRKIIKSTAEQSIGALLRENNDDLDAIAEALINGDPEFDIETTGEFIKGAIKVFVNKQDKPVFSITAKELVYAPDGELKEEREPKAVKANVNDEEVPLKWSGKYFKKSDILNKFIFGKKYQVTHNSGLTYDYLYEIAKDLADKDSMMLVGSGKKGMGPLVFQEGGSAFRAFLEGRVKDDSYLLLLHLSNLELKALPKE